jgi:hypothetical protein
MPSVGPDTRAVAWQELTRAGVLATRDSPQRRWDPVAHPNPTTSRGWDEKPGGGTVHREIVPCDHLNLAHTQGYAARGSQDRRAAVTRL